MARYEALILLLWYGAYVTFMKYNDTLEKFVKKLLNRSKVDKINTDKADSPPPMVWCHSLYLFDLNLECSFRCTGRCRRPCCTVAPSFGKECSSWWSIRSIRCTKRPLVRLLALDRTRRSTGVFILRALPLVRYATTTRTIQTSTAIAFSIQTI